MKKKIPRKKVKKSKAMYLKKVSLAPSKNEGIVYHQCMNCASFNTPEKKKCWLCGLDFDPALGGPEQRFVRLDKLFMFINYWRQEMGELNDMIANQKLGSKVNQAIDFKVATIRAILSDLSALIAKESESLKGSTK